MKLNMGKENRKAVEVIGKLLIIIQNGKLLRIKHRNKAQRKRQEIEVRGKKINDNFNIVNL